MSGDRIVAVGSAAEAAAALPADAEVIDLAGRTVVPGFIDAHNHFACTVETFFAVDAKPSSAGSIEQLRVLVDHAAERTPPGGWIRGFGMDWTKFSEGRRPTRWDLDDITRAHPVVILHVSGHYALVNSKALEDQGIGDDAARSAGWLVRAGRLRATDGPAARRGDESRPPDVRRHRRPRTEHPHRDRDGRAGRDARRGLAAISQGRAHDDL